MHFEMIARVIRNARETAGCSTLATRTVKAKSAARLAELEGIARDFANELAACNGRFDRERFLRACEPDGGYTERSRPSRSRSRPTHFGQAPGFERDPE
jgi:hypothetical protein